MSTYKNLSHQNRAGTEKLPFYRPLDNLVVEGNKHRKQLISYGICVVALLLMYAGISYYQGYYQSKANELLAQGDTKGVLEKYPRSQAAILTGIKLGHEALQKGQYDEAISYYTPLTEKKSLPAMIRIASTQNLALAYLNKNENDQALNLLKKIEADSENANKDYTQLLEARVLEVKGEETGSQEIYRQLSEGAISQEIKEEAKARLKVVAAPEATSPEKAKK